MKAIPARQPDLIGGHDFDPTWAERSSIEVPKAKWARALVELVEVLEAEFMRQGVPENGAFLLASKGALAVAEHHGGRQFYLPRGDALRTALRDAEIFRKANRNNIEALAAEHRLTVSQVYRICRIQQKLHVRRVQGHLFDDTGDS